MSGLDHIPREGAAVIAYHHGAIPVDYVYLVARDRPIIGFTDLFNRYRYRLIGIDTHRIGIGKIGIGMV